MEDYCKHQQRMIGTSFPQMDGHSLLLSLFDSFSSLLRFRPFWRKNFYELRVQVANLRHKNEPLAALEILIEGLKHNHFGQDHVQKWWILMRTAVSLVQDLQLHNVTPMVEPIKKLEELSLLAPTPWEGFDVAYSFAALSVWSMQQGKTQKAIDQVNIAIHADSQWGQPEYLLGSYGLSLGTIDPLPHFIRAVQIDKNYLTHLQQDPLVKQYPHLLRSVIEHSMLK